MLAIALLLLQAAPATPVIVTAPPRKERKICRATESTGSRLGGASECHTATEWKALQGEADARDVNAMMNMKGFNAGATSDGATGKR